MSPSPNIGGTGGTRRPPPQYLGIDAPGILKRTMID